VDGRAAAQSVSESEIKFRVEARGLEALKLPVNYWQLFHWQLRHLQLELQGFNFNVTVRAASPRCHRDCGQNPDRPSHWQASTSTDLSLNFRVFIALKARQS
jgi:hypothetical protein